MEQREVGESEQEWYRREQAEHQEGASVVCAGRRLRTRGRQQVEDHQQRLQQAIQHADQAGIEQECAEAAKWVSWNRHALIVRRQKLEVNACRSEAGLAG